MIAVRIGPDWRLTAVASPGYLQTHGILKHPNDRLDTLFILILGQLGHLAKANIQRPMMGKKSRVKDRAHHRAKPILFNTRTTGYTNASAMSETTIARRQLSN